MSIANITRTFSGRSAEIVDGIVRTVFDADFRDFPVVDVSLYRVTGSYPREVADKMLELMIAKGLKSKIKGRFDYDGGQWDDMQVRVQVRNDSICFSLNDIQRLGDKIEKFTGFKFKNLRVLGGKGSPVIEFGFVSYNDISNRMLEDA